MKSHPVLVLSIALCATFAGVACHRRPRVQTQVVVIQPPTGLMLIGAQIDVKGDIEFDTGAATIRDSLPSQTVLNAVLLILQSNPSITRVRIEGHTDSDGTPAANLVLSDQRSTAVVRWLVERGVSPGRLSPVGCGQTDPLVPNTSPENKQRNRRTEFDIEEMGGRRPDGFTAPCTPNPLRR